MKSIGIIEEERLKYIPKKLWLSHEFCFYLHDQLAHLLVQYEESGVQNQEIKVPAKIAAQLQLDVDEIDVIDLLKNLEEDQPYKHVILSQVILALTADMLHFLYESLICFEKHKLSVAFSLLRKPLKEHLLFLCWILADEDDFLKRFEKNPYETLNRIGKEKQLKLMEEAAKKVVLHKLLDYQLMWEIIYSKQHQYGFESTWQRATHLVTSHGKLLRTKNYYLNFIFENSDIDGHYHEFLYSKLPHVLMFLSQITFECFNRIHPLYDKTLDYHIVTTVGCYESLYSDGKKNYISRTPNSVFKDFFKCVHCGAEVRIKKKYAPTFYLGGILFCEKCEMTTEIPLYWLMCHANASIAREVKEG